MSDHAAGEVLFAATAKTWDDCMSHVTALMSQLARLEATLVGKTARDELLR